MRREERRLLDAGTKPEDKRILDLEDKAFAQAMSLKEELNSAGEKLVKVLDYNVQAGEKQTSEARATLASSIWTILIVVGLSTGVMLAAGVVLARTISRTLRALIDETCRLSAAAVAGKLQTRGNPDLVAAEFRPIVDGVNATLDAVIGPLNVSAEYVDRISKGDIPARITDTYHGDFNEIENNLNQCIDAVAALVADAEMLSKAAVAGQLATRRRRQAPGRFPQDRPGRERHARRRDRTLERRRPVCGPDLQRPDPAPKLPTPTTAISTPSRIISTSASTPSRRWWPMPRCFPRRPWPDNWPRAPMPPNTRATSARSSRA